MSDGGSGGSAPRCEVLSSEGSPVHTSQGHVGLRDPVLPPADLASQIDRLSSLVARGLLSDAEFTRAKERLIDALSRSKSSSSSSSSSKKSSASKTRSGKHSHHGKSTRSRASAKSSKRGGRRRSHSSGSSSDDSRSTVSTKDAPFNVHVVPNKWRLASNAFMAVSRADPFSPPNEFEDGADDGPGGIDMPGDDNRLLPSGSPTMDTIYSTDRPASEGSSEAQQRQHRHHHHHDYGTFGPLEEPHTEEVTTAPAPAVSPTTSGPPRKKKKRVQSFRDVARHIRADVSRTPEVVTTRCFTSSGHTYDSIEDAARAIATQESNLMHLGNKSETRSTAVSASRLKQALVQSKVGGGSPVVIGFDEHADVTDDPCPDIIERKTFSPLDDLSFQWTWIDVTGRDEHREREAYNAVCQNVTHTFGLCPSLLIDRDFDLQMPQIIEAASNDHQFLLVLRVANDCVHTLDDNMLQLTNRWILVIDVDSKLVVSLHRIDKLSFAVLRTQWRALMRQRIAFEEFLVKLIDDSVNSYAESLNVTSTLIDLCENKLSFSASSSHLTSRRGNMSADTKVDQISRARIRQSFTDGSDSYFMKQLLAPSGRVARGDMNRFLYHLHRRSSVLYRALALTQEVLSEIFTELKLCSKDRADQMCSHCSDLASKAQEARDEAEHMLNMHIALVSFQTNELMGMLTQFSIFFAPLSFIAGWYGMNFKHMPELDYEYGYFICLGAMAIVALTVWFFFRRRLGN